MLRLDAAALWQEGCAVVSLQCNQDCALHGAVRAVLSPPALQVTIAVSFGTSFPVTEKSPFLKNLVCCLFFSGPPYNMVLSGFLVFFCTGGCHF